MTDESNRVILFAKFPEIGAVKTRIGVIMGDVFACRLYVNLLKDSLDRLREVKIPSLVSIAPAWRTDDFKRWAGDDPCFGYAGQQGEDLGERMANAFCASFASGFVKCVLIGSDLPDLPASIFAESLTLLDTNGAVVGPAADGGYYLIGFHKRHFLPAAFQGIRWSASSVLENTIAILQRFEVRVAMLKQLQDIDTIEDLARLARRYDMDHGIPSRTRLFVQKHRQAIEAVIFK